MARCLVPPGERQRLFWATQPDACGSSFDCGNECGSPGLVWRSGEENCDGGISCRCCPPPTYNPDCPPTAPEFRSISTDNWIRGLVINMMMTDGRSMDTSCGIPPGSNGGHWSESYIVGGPATIGTLMRTVPPQPRMSQSISLVSAYAKATLQRLVDRGIAIRVDVEGSYLGSMRMLLEVTVVGMKGESARVDMVGSQLQGAWIWSADQ